MIKACLESSLVIIVDILLVCSCNCIVVLWNTKGIKNVEVGGHYVFYLLWSWCLVNYFKCVHMVVCVQHVWSVLNLLFEPWPRREVSSPEEVWISLVWEEIIRLHWPFYIFSFECINVSLWCTLNKLHIDFWVLVGKFNSKLQIFKLSLCILPGKVISPHHHCVLLALLAGKYISDVINKHYCSLFAIVVVKSGIILNWTVIVISLVILESFLKGVVVAEDTCKDLLLVSEVFVHRSPDEGHFFICFSMVFICIVNSTYENCIKAEVGEESCISNGVAKWINHPTNLGVNSEFFLDPSVSDIHIGY